MATNVSVKFHYSQLHIDKALENFRKSNNKENTITVCSACGPFSSPKPTAAIPRFSLETQSNLDYLWKSKLMIKTKTEHSSSSSSSSKSTRLLHQSYVSKLRSRPKQNAALPCSMPDFTSSPNGEFWTTWYFIGRPLYISAQGYHAGRTYSVLRTTLPYHQHQQQQQQ